MRIIFTTHTYYPLRDGVAIVNDYLTKGLVQKGYDVIVVTQKVPGQMDEENYNGIRIYRKYEKSMLHKEYVDFVARLLGEEDVLVSVCTQTPTTDLILPVLGRINCKTKILYVHGIWHFGWEKFNKDSLHSILSKIYNNSKWGYYYWHNRKYFRKYDIVTQLHENDDGYTFFRDVLGIKSCIIENAADLAFFDECDLETKCRFKKRNNLPDRYLLCVANYGKAKNQEFVLRAYYESDSTDELIFIGKDTTEYISYLKKVELSLKNDKSCKKVRYLTNIHRDDISLYVRNAYLFLFGSVGEKFPMSIVEPMAAGVPYISTDVGVVRFFPGGEVVKNSHEMAELINKYLVDKDYYKILSEAGRSYAYKHFRQEEKINCFERILTKYE